MLSVSKPSHLMDLCLIWAYFGLTRDKPANLNLSKSQIFLMGMPSCIRGDCEVENIEVARRMEAVKGVGRGSFIWGKYSIMPFLFDLKIVFKYPCKECS